MSRPILSKYMRYLADKVVDVLMFVFISSLIASVPYFIIPSLSPGQVFLSVAIATGVALLLTLLIGPKIRSKGRTKDDALQAPLGDEIHAYDYPELSSKLPWETFLPQAREEIIVLGGSSESLARKTYLLKELLQQNGDLTITCLIVNPGHDELLDKLAIEKRWAGLKGSARSTLDRITELKTELTDDERKRLKLMTYNIEPPFNMVILDPQLDSGQMQFGHYISGIDPKYRIVNVFRKSGRKELFDKYWKEYKTLLDKCTEYPKKSVSVDVTAEALKEEELEFWVDSTTDWFEIGIENGKLVRIGKPNMKSGKIDALAPYANYFRANHRKPVNMKVKATFMIPRNNAMCLVRKDDIGHIKVEVFAGFFKNLIGHCEYTRSPAEKNELTFPFS